LVASAAFHGPPPCEAATPDSKGHNLVARDGSIFSFGAAAFYGSTGSIVLNAPIVGTAG
jgi:hypothetical protein